jgi:hypothetical protein
MATHPVNAGNDPPKHSLLGAVLVLCALIQLLVALHPAALSGCLTAAALPPAELQLLHPCCAEPAQMQQQKQHMFHCSDQNNNMKPCCGGAQGRSMLMS